MPEPAGSHDFVYVHTDIPEGMTIREWRAQRAADASRRRSAPREQRRRRRAGSCRRWLAVRAVRAALRRAACAWPRGSTDDAPAARRRRGRRAASPASRCTLIEGTPRHLPGVALGSPVLLHAERALALLAVTVAALSIVVQAARGRLPIELSTSGLRYEAEAADDAAAAVAQLQEQFDDLVAIVDALADRLDAPQRRP